MKPLYLSIEGLAGKEKSNFDFTTQTAGLAAICNQDITELKELLALGFYGNGEKGKIELAYEYNGEEYVIKRNFDTRSTELSCRDGSVICEGLTEVNNQINSHLKLSERAFDKLVVIDRDNIYNNFMESAEAREHYVGSLLDELVFDKAEISLIEEKIKEKYDKTLMQIEITEEVSPKELADLKEEIKDKSVIRHDINTELEALYDAIKKGEEATEAMACLEKEKELLKKAEAKLPIVKQLKEMLIKSSEAEIFDNLIERKQSIIENDKILVQRRDELQEQINKDRVTLEKGDKSDRAQEKVLVHCLERLKELRKVLYNRIDLLSGEGDYQQTIKEKINSYYKKEDEELAILKEKKASIDTELSALEKSYEDINNRIKEIEQTADLKKALREGAVLEAEMKKLVETISATKLSIEACDKRLSAIVDEKSKKEEEYNKNKFKLIELGRMITGNSKTKEEAILNAEAAREELHKYSVQISSQQQEIDAIDKKIEENRAGMNEYREDMEVLNGAKEGLAGYITKQKRNIEVLEDRLFNTKVNYNQLKQIMELEYGQECPLCSSVVLNKKYKNYKIEDQKSKIDKTAQELNRAREVLSEYDQKMQLIAIRTGELSARIKISEAYISSLNENKQHRLAFIHNLLLKAGASSSYELSQLYNMAKEKCNKLNKAEEDHKLLEKEVMYLKENIEFLNNESVKIDSEELPSLVERFKSSNERLAVCQYEYKAANTIFGGGTATEKLEEMALAEKEYDTLMADLNEKKLKIHKLLEEKEKTAELIYALEGRMRSVVIRGKEYDYQSLNIKVIGDSIGEILGEIRKSEDEVEQIKTELAAIRKVIANIAERNNKNLSEFNHLNARIESNKEILEQIMSDYNGKLTVMKIDNTKELRKLILTEERKNEIKDEIDLYNNEYILRSANVERMQKLIDDYSENISQLEENKQTSIVLKEKYEELGLKIASITARRTEMKSRAKQLFALKEKLAKYEEKLKTLGEIVHLINENGDITNFIIKLASKRLYSLSKGKYNLDTENGELVLINNGEGGKIVNKNNYTKEEKMLISLVVGTSLHRSLIDMVGGEPFMLIFPLKEKEASKDIASALATYAKKKSLMVVADNKTILNELGKLN